MNKRKMSVKAIKSPKFPKQPLEKGLSEDSLFDRIYCAQRELSRDDFTALVAERATFDQVQFQQVRLEKTHFKKAQVLDSCFTVCDFANAEWPEASLSRVELLGCHLTGWQCSEAQFQDVLFKECRGSFAQFAFAALKAVRFENCELSEVNFLNVDLSSVTFVNCDLNHADLTGTKLANVDLRSCKIDGVRVGPQELKGAIIDPNQAVAFVRSMGITVKPLDGNLQEE